MKPSYEELEQKCALQQSKLTAINELMGVVEKASDIAKAGIEELELQLEESRREFRAADATIHNLELKLTDMAVQLANAESKCRELAAEAAYLRGEIEQHSNSTHFCEKCGEADPCINDDVCWSLKHPIPATDAFLAEVRAQGVEACAESLLSNDDIGINSEYALMREFAAQLRKGGEA
ncbi:hypothetical protein [Citrobacter freundii]|uniref:hypothetical protein n=1 Tax=Citrobacter freundii TaxID=546 RepID=UPI00081A3055|nr:hypothetical protein [Citrobacter freundii]ANZ86920.1 hypothetical protein CfB38_1999 [Citrobacter freundii]